MNVCTRFYQLNRLTACKGSLGITQIRMLHPAGTMNVCINFYGSPLKRCCDMSPDQEVHRLTLQSVQLA